MILRELRIPLVFFSAIVFACVTSCKGQVQEQKAATCPSVTVPSVVPSVVASAKPVASVHAHASASAQEHDHGAHGHDHHAKSASAHGKPPSEEMEGNPIQIEMKLLTLAMEETVRGIASGDLSKIEHALHRVHSAMESSTKAVKGGTYQPPKNGDKKAKFLEMDAAFHKHLESLVAASRAKDVSKASDAFSQAIKGCSTCHSEFR